MTVVCVTHSVEETRSLGAALAGVLEAGVVIELIGGLGAGKTALAQGVAGGLGVTDRVTSPTFTMVATYEADGRRGITTVLHADLYRVTSGVEADDLAIGELVEESAIALVEWGDVAPDVLGANRLQADLCVGVGADDRVISLDAEGSSLATAALRTALDRWVVR